MRVISLLILFFFISTIAAGCRLGSPHLLFERADGDSPEVPEGGPSGTPAEGTVARGLAASFGAGSFTSRSERFVARGSMTSVALPEARSDRFRATGSSILMDQQALDGRESQP